MFVTATHEGRFTEWQLPKKLRRSETLAELMYRQTMKYKDAAEDRVFPSWWTIAERRDQFRFAKKECIERFMGPEIDEIWYLIMLYVHPDFQRRVVATKLLDWGLNHARLRGEKAYLEASESGRRLYLKKRFTEIGELIVGGEGKDGSTCILWEPASDPSAGTNGQNRECQQKNHRSHVNLKIVLHCNRRHIFNGCTGQYIQNIPPIQIPLPNQH